MNVKELIEKLQLLDGTAAVMIPAQNELNDPGCRYIDVLEVAPARLGKCGYEIFSADGEPKFDAVVICFNHPDAG